MCVFVHVHISLPHTHVLRHARVWGGGECSRSCQLAAHARATSRHRVLGGRGVFTFMTTSCQGLGPGGVVLTFMSTCPHTRATSRQGLGWGSVNFHVNLARWRLMNSKSKRPFEDHWLLFAEAHGHVKGGNARVWQRRFPANCRS